MILRRAVLSLVLVLFAFTTIGIIIGLPESARNELANRLPYVAATGSSSPSAETAAAEPSPSPTPTSAQTPITKPVLTPTPARTSPPASPAASPSAVKPRPTAKPTSPPTRAPKATKKRAKKQAARYLTGPLRKGAGGTVYLTFDDGPSRYTAAILATLSRTHSTATFFHLGANEGDYPRADASIRAQGSKVGNHSYNHPDLTTLTTAQLAWQLRNGPKAKCFRPPYGAANAKVRIALADAGMREVRWTIDTFDWTRPGTSMLAKTGRLKAIRDGSIVLMHDGGGDRSQTVAALPTIIADLQARGFKVRALPYC